MAHTWVDKDVAYVLLSYKCSANNCSSTELSSIQLDPVNWLKQLLAQDAIGWPRMSLNILEDDL